MRWQGISPDSLYYIKVKTGAARIMLQIFFLCSLPEPERGSGPADRLPSLPATAYNSRRLNDCINSEMITYNNIFIPLYVSIHYSVVRLKASVFFFKYIYYSKEMSLMPFMKC